MDRRPPQLGRGGAALDHGAPAHAQGLRHAHGLGMQPAQLLGLGPTPRLPSSVAGSTASASWTSQARRELLQDAACVEGPLGAPSSCGDAWFLVGGEQPGCAVVPGDSRPSSTRRGARRRLRGPSTPQEPEDQRDTDGADDDVGKGHRRGQFTLALVPGGEDRAQDSRGHGRHQDENLLLHVAELQEHGLEAGYRGLQTHLQHGRDNHDGDKSPGRLDADLQAQDEAGQGRQRSIDHFGGLEDGREVDGRGGDVKLRNDRAQDHGDEDGRAEVRLQGGAQRTLLVRGFPKMHGNEGQRVKMGRPTASSLMRMASVMASGLWGNVYLISGYPRRADDPKAETIISAPVVGRLSFSIRAQIQAARRLKHPDTNMARTGSMYFVEGG